jgi:hypothetical protein
MAERFTTFLLGELPRTNKPSSQRRRGDLELMERQTQAGAASPTFKQLTGILASLAHISNLVEPRIRKSRNELRQMSKDTPIRFNVD